MADGRRSLSVLAALVLTGQAHALQTHALDLSGVGPAAQPNVSVDAARGIFVLSWQARLEDGCAALRVAEMSVDGALGEVHEVARGCDWFVNWADFPSLVVADNGDWVTHWLRKTDSATYAYEIRLSRSMDRGRSWSESLVPHLDGTPTEHGFVSMAPAGEDQVLLLWLDGRRGAAAAEAGDGHHHAEAMSLRSAVVDRDGALSERAEIDAQVCSCCGTDLLRVDGEHVAVFRDRSDTEIRDIGVIRRGQSGWVSRGLVHADGWQIAACPVNGPALAARDDTVLAVWATMADSDALSVRTRLLDGDPGHLQLEHDAGVLGRVDASAFGEDWLVSWVGGAEGGLSALRVALLDGGLGELERIDIAPLPRNRNPGMPRMAAIGAQALLLWTTVDDDAPLVDGRKQTRIVGVRISR